MVRCGHWLLAVGLVACLDPALAKVNVQEPNPANWLRQVYDLYKQAEGSPTGEVQATYRLIVDRASRSLAALFRKNDLCEKKAQGVCALDWDFVVDGQDSKLSAIQVGEPVIDGDKSTVTVSFKNFDDKCVNVYSFVRENGTWRVDDILAKSGKDAPVSIAKLLRNYKT